MIRRLRVLIIAIVLVIPFAVANNYKSNNNYHNDAVISSEATSSIKYERLVDDSADLFSPTQEAALLKKMSKLTKYGNIAVVTISSNPYGSTSAYARDYYHERWGIESGSIFLIDMDRREIYIFSDGNNYKVIDNDKAYIICGNVFRYASRGNYYKCSSKALDQMYNTLRGAKIAEPVRIISTAFIALLTALIVNFLYVSSRSKIKKASVKEILKGAEVNFVCNSITVQKTGTHRVYSPVNTDSGSSSRGGRSSGGGGGSWSGGGGHSSGGGSSHSSGGGGGHRF